MVTLLTGSILLLIAFAIAVYFWQRPRVNRGYRQLQPGEPRRYVALFQEPNPNLLNAAEMEAAEALRENLLASARAGNKLVLREAIKLGEGGLYREAMDVLIASCESDRALFALVSYVARDERLKVTGSLAERFMQSWKESPERLTIAEMLHVAALSDDAALYQHACETAIDYWQAGRLPHATADDLLTLIEGEYWILSAGARSSGAGFVLKRSISDFRKQLVSRNNT